MQNLILNILADIVRKTICEKVKKAGCFSILVDESKDCSKKEQLSFVIRYVDDKGVVNENFLAFVETSCQKAEILCRYITNTLRNFH